MNRPDAINTFGKVLLIAIVLGIIRMALSWNAWAALSPYPGIRAAGAGGFVMMRSMVIGTGLWLLLWYFIVHRASNLAKWVYVAIVGLTVVGMIVGASNPRIPGGLDRIIGLVILGLHGFAGGLLFDKKATAWLRRGGDPTS